MAEESERKVFVGDCLFEGSIGRTHLPGGSYEQLMDSITNKILTLATISRFIPVTVKTRRLEKRKRPIRF